MDKDSILKQLIRDMSLKNITFEEDEEEDQIN